MNRLEKTPRENIRVKFYVSKKGSKEVITAQLTDEQGTIIQGARASYTLQKFDTEKEGKIAARSRALQRMDELFRGSNLAANESSKTIFSDLWFSLSEDEKRICIAERCSRKRNQRHALTYFENNVLPQLDQYGPTINEDQLQNVVEFLFQEMLRKKNYRHCFATRAEAINSKAFFNQLKQKTHQMRSELKGVFGHSINKMECDELITQVENKVLEEQRLRSLLENWLSNQEIGPAVQSVWNSIKKDEILLSLLEKKGSREQAVEKIILLLRIMSGNETQTKNQVNSHVREINCILRGLCLIKESGMPLIALPEYPIEKALQTELCKELEWKQGVRFASLCMGQAAKNSYACGGLTMLISGPRIAEVCAIEFGEILDKGDWGVVVINYTADGEIRKMDGKNIYFHRPIFLPKIVMDAVHLRQEALRNQGYSAAEISTAYLASRPDNIFLPANPQDFSVAIKRMLQDAGCREGYWAAVERAIVEEKDFDFFGCPEKSLAAYGLRRHATTMMCNVAKMNPLLVDAILGHRLPLYAEDWSEKIRRDDEWPAILEMMERIVYDPDHTRNPAFSALEIKQEATRANNTTPYQEYELTAPHACKVTVLIQTVGNEEIRYNLPVASKQKNEVDAILDTRGPYCSLAPLRSRGEYEEAKKFQPSQDEGETISDKEDDSIGQEKSCSY